MFQKRVQPKASSIAEIARPSISITSIFVFISMLFLSLAFALFFFRYSSFSPLFRYYQKSPKSTEIMSSVNTALGDTASDNVELKITENQISQAVCLDCDSFPLKKSTLAVGSEGIKVTGRTSGAFWGINIETILVPKVNSGKLVFEIGEIKAAGVKAPPKITETLSPKLAEVFNNLVPTFDNVELTEVYSQVGYLRLIGKKK